jgi:SAM-dependent methyltransferase
MACNICGNATFGGGPGNRVSRSGKLPRCSSCQSLERHRAARAAFDLLNDDDFAEFDVLQFSRDRSAEASWFRSYEVSEYGSKTSLDLQKIDRPTGRYDMVICNHVMEHVPYDNAALNELTRVVKTNGFVFLTFPDPANIARTTDWGYPRKDQHYHFRIYGKDVEERFKAYIPHRWVLRAPIADPATGVDDLIYFLAKSHVGALRVMGRVPNTVVIQRPEVSS